MSPSKTKSVPSEVNLATKEYIANSFAVVLLLMGAMLIWVSTTQAVGATFSRPSSMMPWGIFVPAVFVVGVGLWVAIAYSKKCSTLRRLNYQEIHGEAVIDGPVFDDANEHRNVRLVLVKGKNRMGGYVYKVVTLPAKQVDNGQFAIGQKFKL